QFLEAFASRQAKRLMPASVGVGRQRQGHIVVGERLSSTALAKLRNAPVLEHPDQPGNERSLAIVPGQHRHGARRFRHEEVAPKLGHGTLLALFIARVKAYRPGTQGIDEQEVRATGASGKKVFPGLPAPFQTGRGDKPIEWVKVIKITRPRDGTAFLGPVNRKGALEMSFEPLRAQLHRGYLHAAEVIKQLGP